VAAANVWQASELPALLFVTTFQRFFELLNSFNLPFQISRIYLANGTWQGLKTIREAWSAAGWQRVAWVSAGSAW